MITNITNTPRVVNIAQTQLNKHQQIKTNQNVDTVSFTGLSTLTRTKNIDEIKELIQLLHKSNMDSRYKRNPNFKPNWFTNISDKINRAVDKFFKLSVATDSTTVTAITKKGNKVVGGYTMYLVPENCTAYVEFITLSPELKNTKTGKDILLGIGKSIHEHLKDTHITEIAWQKDKKCMNLFKKLKPIYTNENMFTSDEYIMFVDKFGKSVEDLMVKYQFQGK